MNKTEIAAMQMSPNWYWVFERRRESSGTNRVTDAVKLRSKVSWLGLIHI